GAPATPSLADRTRSIPGAGGYAGGVGGKLVSPPAPAGVPVAQPGDDPGGGAVGADSLTTCGRDSGFGGQNTANAFLVPLVGGSGGGGANSGPFSPTDILSNGPYGGGGGAGGGGSIGVECQGDT